MSDLVQRAREGDRDAFGVLASQSVDRLYAIAVRVLRDRSEAEDAVQSALLDAWRDLPKLREVERFDAWLYRLLMRACLDADPSRRRFGAVVKVLDLEPAAADGTADSIDRDRVERAFQRLSVEQRAVVTLHHYWSLPLTEAADALGLSDVRSTPQRRLGRLPNRRILLGFAGAAAVLVVLVVSAQLRGNSVDPGPAVSPPLMSTPTPSPTPRPTRTPDPVGLITDNFRHRFTVIVPGDLRIDEVRDEPELYMFTTLASSPDAAGLSDHGYVPGANGLIVASLEDGEVDSCPTRFGESHLAQDPEALMADLKLLGGMTLEATETTVDARRAWTIEVTGLDEGCGDHAHIAAPEAYDWLPSGAIWLDMDNTITQLVDIDGDTVLIQIFADSPEDFEIWEPIARRILSHIDFHW